MGAAARIRNISSTGRRNRFYGSVILFSCAIVVNFVYLIVGEPPMPVSYTHLTLPTKA